MNRREFIKLVGITTAAGATYREAFGEAMKYPDAKEISKKPEHCGECEHFLNAGYCSSGSMMPEGDDNWCQYHNVPLARLDPVDLKPCRQGIKIGEF